MMDFTERLSRPLCLKIFSYVSFREKVRLEVVAKKWRQIALDSYRSDQRGSVWLYVIFRKNRISGHDGLSVKFSYDGPIFWQRLVAYVYTCCCHFQQPRNELTFKSLCDKLSPNIDRVCMVDTPINFPFLSDSLVRHLLDSLPQLQWIYLRELDLENVTVQTVAKLAQHPALKKVILHFCRYSPIHPTISYALIRSIISFQKCRLLQQLQFSPTTPDCQQSDSGAKVLRGGEHTRPQLLLRLLSIFFSFRWKNI